MQLPHMPCVPEIGRAHITRPEHQEQRTQCVPARVEASSKRRSRGSGLPAGHESDARLFLREAIARIC